MTPFDIKAYTDTFGHVYAVDLSAGVMKGGQGIVLRTTEVDLALKIITCDPETDEIITDDSNNDKYLSLRILPIPHGLQITLPQVALKGVEGYVMTLLNGMTEFQKAFTLGKKYFDEALSDDTSEVNRALLKFFETAPKISQKRRAKIYSYMKTGGVRRRLMAYMKSAAILVRLHTSGLVYCDFSDKNVFISTDLNYSNVWLIDADNLVYSELIEQSFYTPGFVAPEIIRGEADCSFYSDSFSFAVALFNTLFGRHPFDGQAYQDALDELGEEVDLIRDRGDFAWILDADDDSNDGRKYLFIPDKFILSDGLRELFQQMFSADACQDPTLRPTMIQWVRETAFAFDNVIYSKNCGLDFLAESAENFSICPFDDLRIPAVRLKSYLTDAYGKKLSVLWQFTHELTDEKIAVPLRILNGFACRELEKIAFVLTFKGGKILIRGETAEFSFAYTDGKDDETSFCNCGSFWVEQKFFSIKCRHKNGRCVLVEGEQNG